MSQIRIAAAQLICRYCRRPMSARGSFWADDGGQIYCHASHGQHVPVAKEPDDA